MCTETDKVVFMLFYWTSHFIAQVSVVLLIDNSAQYKMRQLRFTKLRITKDKKTSFGGQI